jgi:hypothetical protein
MLVISWSRFDGLLPDQDLINVTVEPGAVSQDKVELRLESAPWITWWKGITLVTSKRILRAETQDNNHGQSIVLDYSEFYYSIALSFEKAKFFGNHTGVYVLSDFTHIPRGSRARFRWVQDEEISLWAKMWPNDSGLSLPRKNNRYVAQVNQPFTAEIVVGNNTEGNLWWSRDSRIRLSSTYPDDNLLWGVNRVEVPDSEYVPGFLSPKFVFRFACRAPDKPGSYAFNWQMIQEGVTRFGENFHISNIDVVPAPAPPPPPPPNAGTLDVVMTQQPTSWLTYNGKSGDPSVTDASPQPRNASIVTVTNTSAHDFQLAHLDTGGVRSEYVLLRAGTETAAPFSAMTVKGSWQAQYRGTQADAPPTLGIRVSWRVG